MADRILAMVEDVRNNLAEFLKKEEFGVFMEQKGKSGVFMGNSRAIREFRLKEEEKKMLESIAENPYIPVSERYRKLGMNAYRGKQVKNSLIEKGLIEDVRIKKPDRAIKLLKLTERGIRITGCGEMNESPEHGFQIREIERILRRRYDVVREMNIGDKRVDLVYSDDGLVAVEVETGKSNFVENARKCLKHGFRKVVMVGINEEIRDKMKEKLDFDERLEIVSVKEFLKNRDRTI